MRNLRSNSSSGADGIPNIVLKKLAFALAYPLSRIIRLSFLSGRIPHDWKHSIIVPLPKKSSMSSNLGDYRPISLTSCVCKVMEQMVREQLLQHCVNKNILCNYLLLD